MAEHADWARQKVLQGGSQELVSEFPRLKSNEGVAGRLSGCPLHCHRAVMTQVCGLPGGSQSISAQFPCRVWHCSARHGTSLWKRVIRAKPLVQDTSRETRTRKYFG